jgi:hypothetical protein
MNNNKNENSRNRLRGEVLQGTQNVIDAEVQFFSKAQTRADTYMNYIRPP